MIREHENSQPLQTFLNQRLSTLESVIERYEEEMKKSWEEQQTSSMKILLIQMLGAKEEVEEQESEEVNQENSHSSEAEKYIEEELMELPIQKALDEDKTPMITQPPSTDNQEVKATNKSTNPTPDLASKLNQAINKRKLAEERPRQGAIVEFSPHLKSFLLTNWKKRKKVKNNMSS
ncbi:uncharacterized protein DS421_13g419800 [Arachis hypogaea]|nr:uncharacterized protein DS421_13g419800 [Arachis hypogaea]